MNTNRILVIAAHPDDEVLGCGGAIARYAGEGNDCHIVIMAEGITSRGESHDPGKFKDQLNEIEKQARKASEILGAKSVDFMMFPDNRMDSVDFLDIVKTVEKAINRFQPDVIFTHHYGDLNLDHRLTARAVETATRPMEGRHLVSEVYSFETPSSTEWSFGDKNDRFHPNCYIDISDHLELKTRALNIYGSEIRSFPHPRSVDAVISLAKTRGSASGLHAAEAFCMIRKVIQRNRKDGNL